ncbi:MAG: FMN-binding negative transcriptional regulator [Dehalococcoidia bacterium]|nr:FMN-binding negative transcriptional regulator [Dehalococcoidia bacterium]MCB9484851.1 FMN-binding negative transcriptional regulator [Thermoflexaceae bacterium]
MYVPRAFAIEDLTVIHEVMRQNSFAMLVTSGLSGLEATHLPVALSTDGPGLGTLRAHIARANRQWESFDGELEALFIFAGQHGYISPSWYEAGPAVPTWDYVAVHAYGRPRVVDDEAQVLSMLNALVSQYEKGMERPWALGTQDQDWVRTMAGGIVAFEVEITRVDAKAKLGQNRPADQARVATALEALGARELAALIREAAGGQ